jgi:hypothetical protein
MGMKIVKTVLNLILLICFAVTDIVYTIPSGYPVLNRSALRPISTKNSTLASDIKPKATPAERETDYWYSRAIAMQELEEAEKSYLQNDL